MTEERREELIFKLYNCADYFYRVNRRAHSAYYMRKMLNDTLEGAKLKDVPPLEFEDLINEALARFDPECTILD